MKTIKLQKVDFGTLKVGDKFSLSPNYDVDGENHFNVVVKPSLLLDNIGSPNEHPFNVVSLTDGRPRSFQAGQTVYKLVKVLIPFTEENYPKHNLSLSYE